MTWFMSTRGIMTRTATHSGSWSGDTVGDSKPGAAAVAGEEVADESGVTRSDPHTLEVGQLAESALGAGEAEGGVAESERRDLSGIGPGIEQEVATGDADVERAGAHVGGDVTGTEVEELDPVARVGGVQVARVAATGVPGLPQHLRGGLGEPALVGHGDSEHFVAFVSTVLIGHERDQRCRYTSAGESPFAS